MMQWEIYSVCACVFVDETKESEAHLLQLKGLLKHISMNCYKLLICSGSRDRLLLTVLGRVNKPSVILFLSQ